MNKPKRKVQKANVALSLIVASLFGLLATNFYSQYETELDTLHLRHKNQQQALQGDVETAIDVIQGLQTTARSHLEHAGAFKTAYGEKLGLVAGRGGYGLTGIPAPADFYERLNLTGLGSLEAPELMQELETVFSLEPMLKWVKGVYPETPWVYYLSARRFMAVYPYIPFEDFFMDDGFYDMDLYRLGTPEVNAEGSQYITPVYEDEAGQGLMVTIGAPVYMRDKFVGIVGFDLTLASLSKSIQALHYRRDVQYLLNESGEVIAQAGAVIPSAENFKPIQLEKVRPGVQVHLKTGSRGENSFYYDGKLFHATRIRHTPWTLVSERSQLAIVMDSALASLPLLLFLFALAVGVVMFIRERHYQELARAEESLLRERDKLQDMVEEKTRDLREAKDVAEAATKAKSTFLANMSHEIRTPLNAVLGFARIGQSDSSDSVACTSFERISRSGELLLRVLNDILDFSKIEEGKLTLEEAPFKLIEAIEEARDMLVDQARRKSLSLSLEIDGKPPEWVSGDRFRVQQILLNLISNAIKYTERGTITVVASWQSGIAVLKVTDTGIGLTQEQLSRVFRSFEQADSSTIREHGGAGLGLAITYNLVELMGGTLKAISQPGQGSEFSVNIPLPMALGSADTNLQASLCEAKCLDGLSILAAEDDSINRSLLEHLLTREGARVVFAENGQEALDRIWEHGVSAFDLVLMDVQMPLMDGYEATRRIREIAPGLPVVGLTAHALAQDEQKCLEAGMLAHITKPCEPDDIVSKILEHSGKSASTEAEVT